MKILFNCLSMKKGGAERVISILANKFIEENEVTIVTLSKGKISYNLDNNIKIIEVDKKNFLNKNKIRKLLLKISIKRLMNLKKVIKSEKPNIIISFLPEPSMRLMLIKKFDKAIRDIPTIISIRNNPETEYKNKMIYLIMKNLYKNVDGLVLQTEKAKEYFIKIIKNEQKLKVIPNPVNKDFIVDRAYIGERKKTVVAVGRIERQKNHKLLIDAFREVAKKHKEYKLLIYGDGSLKTKLQEYVRIINLSDRIEFKGIKNNIKDEIYKAGVFVLSSYYEGMPNALMEAMALGLPCVSTDCPCGGPRYLIENETNGVLVKVNDIDNLSMCINKLIENKELAKKIGDNANKSMKEYTPEKICQQWSDFINFINEKRK